MVTLYPNVLPFPVLWRPNAGLGKGQKCLLTALSEQCDSHDRQTGVGPALQHRVGVRGRKVDLTSHHQTQMLSGRVLDVHFQTLFAEVALLLGDVRGDERQVGLRLEPGHECNAG